MNFQRLGAGGRHCHSVFTIHSNHLTTSHPEYQTTESRPLVTPEIKSLRICYNGGLLSDESIMNMLQEQVLSFHFPR